MLNREKKEQGRWATTEQQGFPAGFCYWLHVRGRSERTREEKRIRLGIWRLPEPSFCFFISPHTRKKQHRDPAVYNKIRSQYKVDISISLYAYVLRGKKPQEKGI